MKVGIPDLISLLSFFAIGINTVPISTLEYISLGVKSYGSENLTLIIECFKIKNDDDNKNKTCKDMGETIQSQLASLNVSINIVKGILAPIFVFVLGGFSDAIGRRFPIMYILIINILWCIMVLVNTIFPTRFPPGLYIFQNGILLGVCGGSTFAVSTFLVGYLSIITPPQQQTVRFSTLAAVGLLGYVIGPFISGLIMAKTFDYSIIGIISTSLAVVAFLLAIFALKPVDDNKAIIDQMVAEKPLCKKFVAAMKFQYHNTKDLFKYQAYLPKFIGAILMYMLTSVGLISPLVVISSVYVLGAPFKWSNTNRGYFGSGLGLLLAVQAGLTVKVMECCKLSRPAIVRIGIFIGFVGTFFLAFAANNFVLLTGVALSSFIIVASPTIQSMVLSLVEPEQVGTTVGLMAAVQSLAECGLVNIILFVFSKTRDIMNGFCFFTLSLFLGIDLVIAMFYQHPQITREDRNPLETDEEGLASPVVPSSDVLKGGVPKTSTRSTSDYRVEENIHATIPEAVAENNCYSPGPASSEHIYDEI